MLQRGVGQSTRGGRAGTSASQESSNKRARVGEEEEDTEMETETISNQWWLGQ